MMKIGEIDMVVNKVYNTIIIGGGPAGLMCAYQLAKANVDFLLIERNDYLGKKLLLTGGARCNVTNNKSVGEFINSLTISHKGFLYSPLTLFGPQEIVKFFNDNDCALALEEGYKYFPITNKSCDVLDVFVKNIPEKRILLNTSISKISKTDDVFIVESLKDKYFASNLVLATGSKSYPQTGSTGDALELLKEFKIAYVDFTPAETHVYAKQVVNELSILQGTSLNNVNVGIKNTKIKARGDLLFTHFGLSGPVIFHLSESIYKCLSDNKVVLEVGLTNKTIDEIDDLFKESSLKNRSILKTIEQCTTNRIASFLLTHLKITNKNINEISKKDQHRIIKSLTTFEIIVDRVNDLRKAFVNKGGILTSEINPKTMEIKKVTNLYCIGETVDLHGPIGGYNITIALSTAFAASQNIIKK